MTQQRVSTNELESWERAGMLTDAAGDLLDARRELARLKADRRALAEALSWIMPMAKGYAREHAVGRNVDIVMNAEDVLAAHDAQTEGK